MKSMKALIKILLKNPSAIALAETGEAGIRKGKAGPARSLPQKMPNIPVLSEENKGKKCLVLDLDETLVHSSLREEKRAHGDTCKYR